MSDLNTVKECLERPQGPYQFSSINGRLSPKGFSWRMKMDMREVLDNLMTDSEFFMGYDCEY